MILGIYAGKPDPNGAEPPEEKAGNGHKGA